MPQFVLTDHEVTTLLHILEADHSDLRMEIANTDRMEFRDQLKDTKLVLESVIEKLQKSVQERSPAQPALHEPKR